MAEDIQSDNFSSGTLFLGLDEDDIPDTAIAQSPSTPKVSSLEIANLTGDEPIAPEDGEPKLELSPSDVERLTALRNTVADNPAVNNSEEGLVELIDAQIAETAGTRVASQFNGVPEEGIGDDDDDDDDGDDDDDDDDDDDGGIKVGTDDDDLVIGTTADESMFGKRGKDTLRGTAAKTPSTEVKMT
ncbi:MAG: hypothetical protein HC849_10585, partial [Oscillatoriales cyanobacterium RU_3_3]|nr:hypothetical protein [Oscillatoriales cyanobacterium RU_3_3]